MITHTLLFLLGVSLLYSSNFRLLLAQLLNCRSKTREGGHFGHTAAEFVHQKEERLEATSMVHTCYSSDNSSHKLGALCGVFLKCFIFNYFIILHLHGSCGILYWKCLSLIFHKRFLIIIVDELLVFSLNRKLSSAASC